MSRRFRKLLYAWGALVVLTSAALGGMKTAWFQRALERRVVTRLENLTGGRIEISEFRFRPTMLRITFRGFILHGKEIPGEAPFFSARTVAVRLNPASLLRRRLLLWSLEWDAAQIHLYTRADGSSNLPRSRVLPEPSQAFKELMDLSIERLTLARTQFFWNEQDLPVEVRAHDVAILLRLNDARRYSGSLSSSTAMIRVRRWSLPSTTFTTRFEFSGASLVVSSLAWQCASFRGEGAFKLHNPLSPEGQFSFRGSGDVSDLARALGMRDILGGNVNWEGQASYRHGEFVAQGSVHARQVMVQSSRLKLGRIDLSADYSADRRRVELSNLTVSMLGGTAQGRAEISFQGSTPAFVLRTQLRGLDLTAALRSFAAPHTALGRLRLTSTIDGTGEATWSGRLENFTSQFNLQFHPRSGGRPESYPLGGSVRGSARMERGLLLQLQDARFQTPHSALAVTGTLGTQQSKLSLQFATADFEEWRPAVELLARATESIPLRVKSEATFAGAISGPISWPTVRGRFEAGSFDYHGWTWDRLEARVVAAPDFLQISSGRLGRGESTLTLSGQATLEDWKLVRDGPVQFKARLQGTPLEGMKAAFDVRYPCSGIATGQLELKGAASNLKGTGDLRVEKGALAEEPFDLVTTKFRVEESIWYFDDFQLSKGRGRVTGQARLEPSKRTYFVDLHGTDFSLHEFRRLALRRQSNGGGKVEGLASFDLRGQGTSEDGELQATWSIRDIVLSSIPVGNLQGRIDWQQPQMRLKGDVQGPGGSVHFTGEARTEGHWPLELSGQFSDLRLEPWIRQLLGGKFKALVTASGALSVHGPLKDISRLEVQGQAQSLEVSFPNLTWKNEQPIDLHYAKRGLTASRFRMRGPSTDLEVEGSIQFGELAALSLTAQGQADATLLSLMDPALQAAGRSELKVGVSGSSTQPLLYGTVKVQDMSLGYGNLPLRLTGLNGEIALEGERATVRSLRGISGGGTVTLAGFAILSGTPRFDVRADLDQVRVPYPTDFTSVLDGNLRLIGTSERGRLDGELTLRQILASENLNLLARIGKVGSPLAEKPPGVASPFASRIQLDVRVGSSQAVRLETLDVHLLADIDLRLQGTLANPVEVGTIHIPSGEAVFRGNRYALSRGGLSMANPFRTQRILDVEAQTRVQRYDLTLDITGPIDRLKIAYRSDPPLPTEDIVSLLAFGYARQEEMSTTATQPLPAVGTSALLSEALSSQVSGRIQRLFGVSRIKIDPNVGTPGYTGGARVTVEQRVTRDLTLTYVTTTASSQQRIIQFEWAVTDTVSLVGARDQNGIFGLEVKLRRRFK